MSGRRVTMCPNGQLQYLRMESHIVSKWTVTISPDGQSQYVRTDSQNVSRRTVTICPELVSDTHRSSVWCDIRPQTLEYFALSMCVIFGLAHNTGIQMHTCPEHLY